MRLEELCFEGLFQTKKLYIHIFLTRPTSLGYVSLHSSDFRDDPVVDPRYLQEEDDVRTIVEGGIIIIIRIISLLAQMMTKLNNLYFTYKL